MSVVDLLIDGDPLVYACGFVAERRIHVLSWVDVTPEGDVFHRADFDAAWRRDEFIRLKNLDPEEFTSELVALPYPFSFAKQAMRTTIEGIENNVHEFLEMEGMTPGETRIFLTGEGNFRTELAKIKPYKGNRVAARPYWYAKLREHMVERLGATVVNGHEADDEISIIQWGHYRDGRSDRSIICTIDKDLKMVPGLHYHTKNKEVSYRDEAEGMVAFYRQLLTGDSTDNIPGCFKIGPATAEQLIPNGLTEGRMFEIALGTYQNNIERYPEHHAPHTTAFGSLAENAQLLWMLRDRENGTWLDHVKLRHPT